MRLRTLGLVATFVLSLAAPLTADAQPAGRIWRIGYLSLVSGELEQYKPWVAAFGTDFGSLVRRGKSSGSPP